MRLAEEEVILYVGEDIVTGRAGAVQVGCVAKVNVEFEYEQIGDVGEGSQ